MATLPRPAMIILSGVFTQQALSKILYAATKFYWDTSDICKNEGSLWALLLGSCAVMSGLCAYKNHEMRIINAIIAFTGSFFLSICTDLGHMTFYCSSLDDGEGSDFLEILTNETSEGIQLSSFLFTYSFSSFVISLLTCCIILELQFIVCKGAPQASGGNTYFPDPELMLLGVAVQFSVQNCVTLQIIDSWCTYTGLGHWLELFTTSCFLAVLTYIQSQEQVRELRSLATFGGSFILNLSLGSVFNQKLGVRGMSATTCAGGDRSTYNFVTLVVCIAAAAFFATYYMKKESSPADSNTGHVVSNRNVVSASQAALYPPHAVVAAPQVYNPPPPAYPAKSLRVAPNPGYIASTRH